MELRRQPPDAGSSHPPGRRRGGSSADAGRPGQNRRRHRALAPPRFRWPPQARASRRGGAPLPRQPSPTARVRYPAGATRATPQDKAGRGTLLPRQIGETAGQREDPLECCRIPRILGKSRKVHCRKRRRRARRESGDDGGDDGCDARGDVPAHRAATGSGRGRFAGGRLGGGRLGGVTSGGRR
jgi:hypothetical protein